MAAVTKLAESPGYKIWSWTLLSSDATGVAVPVPDHSDLSVSFTSADWTGVTADLEGHLHPTEGSGTYLPVTDPQGNIIQKTANAFEQVQEQLYWIRPILSVPGTGKTITIILKANRKAV